MNRVELSGMDRLLAVEAQGRTVPALLLQVRVVLVLDAHHVDRLESVRLGDRRHLRAWIQQALQVACALHAGGGTIVFTRKHERGHTYVGPEVGMLEDRRHAKQRGGTFDRQHERQRHRRRSGAGYEFQIAGALDFRQHHRLDTLTAQHRVHVGSREVRLTRWRIDTHTERRATRRGRGQRLCHHAARRLLAVPRDAVFKVIHEHVGPHAAALPSVASTHLGQHLVRAAWHIHQAAPRGRS